MPKKILIVRFSSMGDIILTTPVIRCLKKQVAGVEIHFVCKESFKEVLLHNPYIDQLHTFHEDIAESYKTLQSEKFDLIIDLHKNLRSFRLKQQLKTKAFSFNKINLQKLLAVNFKRIAVLPKQHIVERYFDTVKTLGVIPDEKGLDYFISKADGILPTGINLPATHFIALVIGGSYFTKKIPLNKLQEICSKTKLPIVLLGGKEDVEIADKLHLEFPQLINCCGKLSINQSAFVLKQSEWVITSDTGLMHIAAAFEKKIISVWGNTIPEFGMGPYKPQPENRILENKHLNCRPCSKLGYKKCPKEHFDCMNKIDSNFVSDLD